MSVSLSKTHLRMFIPKSGLTILSSAPWKDVFLFCTKTGNVYRTSGSVFRNPYLSTREIFDGGTLANIKVIAAGTAKKFELDCKKYIEPPGFSKIQMQKRKADMIASRSPFSLSYLVTKPAKNRPRAGTVNESLLCHPDRGRCAN